jgi:nucleoside-diphosphate-sugar epimerase
MPREVVFFSASVLFEFEGSEYTNRHWLWRKSLAGHIRKMRLAKNQVLNIAGNEFATISEIVAMLKGTLGEFPLNHVESRPGDFGGVHTSIAKAQKLIGWTPATSFRQGLLKYIEHVRTLQP